MGSPIGKIVQHARFGQGKVQGTREGGYKLFVEFRTGERWVRLDEVRMVVNASPPVPTAGAVDGKWWKAAITQAEGRTAPKPAPLQGSGGAERSADHYEPPSKLEALSPWILGTRPGFLQEPSAKKTRRMIEALRLGIVPYDCVEDFTVGRDSELAVIEDWLECQDHNTLFVAGGYGSGKTHLLSHVHSSATKQKFATAWISMNPGESPFSQPKRVFAGLAQSLRFLSPTNGQVCGFRELVRLGLEQGVLGDNVYFKWLHGAPSERLWEWIECRERASRPFEPEQLPSGHRCNRHWLVPHLYDQCTAANIYCHLLSALGHASLAAGLRGLILLLDEAESVDAPTTAHRSKKGHNFLEALILTADGDTDLLKPACEVRSLISAGKAPLVSFLYRCPPGLKLLFAVTDRAILARSKFATRCRVLDLQPLSEDAENLVRMRVKTLYSQAYDGHPTSMFDTVEFGQDGFHSSTRLMVKRVVEGLDLARFSMAETMGA